MAKRIIFTTFGSLGDLHPYIALALELGRSGYEVGIATSLSLRENIEKAGISFLHVSRVDPIRQTNHLVDRARF